MSSFGVVVDACVLVPAAARDTIVRAAAKGLYRLHWSRDILDEACRALIDGGMTNEGGARRLVAQLEQNFPESMVQGYECLTCVLTNHEKDRHVLAAAIVAGAQVIVTSNLRHFPDESLERFGIEAQSPDAFLTNLLGLAPEVMIEIIIQQAAALKAPPKSPNEVLDILARLAPGFVANIRTNFFDKLTPWP